MTSPITHIFIESAKPPKNNEVPVCSNPAYGEFKVTIMGRIMMKENTAYATLQPAVLPQYENIEREQYENIMMKKNGVYAMYNLSFTSTHRYNY